jgi:hypothetical protein
LVKYIDENVRVRVYSSLFITIIVGLGEPEYTLVEIVGYEVVEARIP